MKMANPKSELRSEYKASDFKVPGVRGKYLASYRAGTNLVLLSPDVAAAFPTEHAVNTALRSLLRVAKQSANLPPRTTRTPRKRNAG